MPVLKRFLPLLLVAILLCGCTEEMTPPTSSSDVIDPVVYRSAYVTACSQLYLSSNVAMEYTLDRQRIIGQQTFTERVEGSLTIKNYRQDDMVAVVSEQLLYGGLESTYKEVFCDGKAYVQVNDSEFALEMDKDAYLTRQYPLALLNADYYQFVRGQVDSFGTTRIQFSGPIAMEPWLRRDSRSELYDATGVAVLDADGNLIETTYQVSYICGDARYVETIAMHITTPKSLDITGMHPEHFENCTALEDADTLKLLLRAVGDVFSASVMNCTVRETIISAAVPVRYTRQSVYRMVDREGEFRARAEHDTSLTDYRGVPMLGKQLDVFENGAYSVTVDGGMAQTNPNITAQMVRSYFEDAVLSAVFNPNYVASLQLQVREDCYYISFRGNDVYLKDMMALVGDFLQMDLDAVSQVAETTEASGYLELDRATGLPVGMGLKLNRQHTLNTVSYDLTYDLVQTLDLLSAG